MSKKEQKQNLETASKEITQKEEAQTSFANPTVTNYAFSMIQNEDQSFSVIKIGFNIKDLYVSPIIEVVETNTDRYIIQERLSILLLEMEIS